MEADDAHSTHSKKVGIPKREWRTTRATFYYFQWRKLRWCRICLMQGFVILYIIQVFITETHTKRKAQTQRLKTAQIRNKCTGKHTHIDIYTLYTVTHIYTHTHTHTHTHTQTHIHTHKHILHMNIQTPSNKYTQCILGLQNSNLKRHLAYQ